MDISPELMMTPTWQYRGYLMGFTESEMSPFWRNFHHWLQWKLSFWQHPVQLVTEISSKWHFHFNVYWILWSQGARWGRSMDGSPKSGSLLWLTVSVVWMNQTWTNWDQYWRASIHLSGMLIHPSRIRWGQLYLRKWLLVTVKLFPRAKVTCGLIIVTLCHGNAVRITGPFVRGIHRSLRCIPLTKGQ